MSDLQGEQIEISNTSSFYPKQRIVSKHEIDAQLDYIQQVVSRNSSRLTKLLL